LQSVFPEATAILAPATSATAINPSELSARGAAVQASLVQEFDKEDIDQSTHPMVTVTPHLHNAIGVQIVSKGDEGAFAVMIAPDSAMPVRRTSLFKAPAGDILVRVCEGEREIKVTKPEKPQTNGVKGSDDEDSDVDDDEEEDIRERVWKAKKTLAEFALKDLKKGGKIEVMVNVGADMALSITAREAGGKGGIRGNIDAPEVVENGKA
jgi:molecular chaperone DnaK (HSP70)